jgi:hypothetical protein
MSLLTSLALDIREYFSMKSHEVKQKLHDKFGNNIKLSENYRLVFTLIRPVLMIRIWIESVAVRKFLER